ncbi:uncharacterized protein [Malus domestica]|uniref:uncharacterized protein n=1 Tax=Malus domestica TaxID=3750 RepID=UPI0039761672
MSFYRSKIIISSERKAPPVEIPAAASPKVDVKSEKPESVDDKVVENGAAYDNNEEESAKSAPNSPFASTTVGSPSREFSDSNYGRTTGTDALPRDVESQSDDNGGSGSVFSGDKGFDEPAWGHLTLIMTLTRCGVSMQLVPPRIWIRGVIRITTFLALGSSVSTLSGLGHHKEVAFPRRAALLLSMILFPAHHCQPSIQDIHHQGTRIGLNLHSTPSPGLIRLEAPKMLDTSLNQKHLEDLILCAAVEILIRVMDFQHLMTSQTLLALKGH